MKAAEDGHFEAMYHLATFSDFISEPFRSPLSEEESWQWLLRAAEGGCVQAQRDAGASLATGERVRSLKISLRLLHGTGVRPVSER